jgi:cytochrome P450
VRDTDVGINPFTPEAIEDPYAVYAELRARGVTYLPEGNLYLVSRFDDVKQLLLDHHTFSSRNVGGERGAADPDLAAVAAEGWRSVAVLTPADPPDHTWYRRLVARSFAPDGVAKLHESIVRIVETLIDGFADRGSCDLVAEFCQPFPLYVFAELMGIDIADIPQIKRWTDDRLEMIAAATGIVPKPRMLELLRSNVEMQRYLYGLVDEVRREPRDDLLTHLVFGTMPGFGERPLDDDELMSMIQTLLDGGNDTTINLVSNGMGLLLSHPDQLAIARNDPSVLGTTVEEVLRVEAPVQCLFRGARVDTELGDVEIPAGARLAVLYGAANRDERRWPDADVFDVRRADAKDALHFGAGIHFCLGAHLARLEGKVAFEALLRRLHGLRLVPGANDFHHHASPIVRGLEALHVEWDV